MLINKVPSPTLASLYAINPTREQRILGSDLTVPASVTVAQSLVKLPPGFPKIAGMHPMVFGPQIFFSAFSNSAQWGPSAKVVLGVAGEQLLEASEIYSAKLHHERYIAQSSVDSTHAVRYLFQFVTFAFFVHTQTSPFL